MTIYRGDSHLTRSSLTRLPFCPLTNSLYIFDRHCTCVYFQAWHRTSALRPGKDVLPGVAPDVSFPEPEDCGPVGIVASDSDAIAGPRSSRLGADDGRHGPTPPAKPTLPKGLPFDEEAKLVYGILFSLRNMVKKLSCKDEDAFIAYKTSTYKFHLYETPSGFKFVLLSDPNVESLRFVLRSIYQSAFIEFVVRNPVMEPDSRKSGRGIDNNSFRSAVDSFISGLSVYR